jgi:hypothetical protein
LSRKRATPLKRGSTRYQGVTKNKVVENPDTCPNAAAAAEEASKSLGFWVNSKKGGIP